MGIPQYEDYPAIQVWGNKLGSYQYYIDGEVAKARKDKAPQDAIYKRDNGTWARVKDIKDLKDRRDMKVFLQFLPEES